MDIKEKVLDAIQMLTANSVEKAGYDKTIQAQIVSCEDATIGKYRCRYQDAVFYAYASSADVTFSNNSYVYILVPGNDFKKEKTILGTTQKLGINYISQAEGDQAYDLIGTNCISSDNTYYLDTNNKTYKQIIYSHNRSNNTVSLDFLSLNHYIKQSSSLIAGATFKTSIPLKRQSRGHYGIIYNLRFMDNTSGQEVVRSYVINEDNMIDNPYRLVFPTRQYQIFDIDGANFIRVESIEIFNSDFPDAKGPITSGALRSGDIQISKLELSGAMRLSDSELNGVAISFFTPQGAFFTENSFPEEEKQIIAQVRVKGKLVTSAQNIPFYWGRENVKITPSNPLYNKQLGRGWQCLNENNVISEATNMSDPVVEWIPGKDTYIIKCKNATARDNRYKVAIIYDNTVITKEINIQNLSTSVPEITIETDSGITQFYYDIGHPTLTCKVNGGEPANYVYYWAYESDTGILSELPETSQLNSQYTTANNNLNTLQNELNNGTKFAKAEENNLLQLETQVQSFKFTQRVYKNKIYDVQIKNITNRGTFKCSVYNAAGVYIGTGSITLTNTLGGEDLYSLVINNGSATFQYNENGLAPNNGSLDVPQQIQALSFTVYDNLGSPIDSNIIMRSPDCSIRWQIPIKDTLLLDSGDNSNSAGTDAAKEYIRYDNVLSLTYNIAQKYDIQKKRNQIRLNVNYKGMNLTAETSFTFVKQGQPGTNGTEFIVKLVPNTRLDKPPLWPMITKAGSKYLVNYGINTQDKEFEIGVGSGRNYQFFKAQLWHNGEKVWEGFSIENLAIDGVTRPTAVHWQVLKNKYNSTQSDASAFVMVTPENGFMYYSGDHLQDNYSTPLANIIKCSITWQDKLYYGTIPVITAWTKAEKYRVSLKDYTGFRYVIYTSDGMTPQWDSSHPFEFICEERIQQNGVFEDVSLVNGAHAITFTPSSCGNIFNKVQNGNPVYTDTNLLRLMDEAWYRKQVDHRDSSAPEDQLLKNQWAYKPASRYDGQCVNAAVLCLYKQGNQTIGKINIPIHFLLNKYGLANINEWDGNSVQINEEGGYILAPQMGAGSKNSHNDFTGVLMGEVRVAGKSAPDNGLLGYFQGDRTFFINSANGSAIFGRASNSDGSQIIIDPSNSNRGLLYSGNFWADYNEDGLPSNYTSNNENHAGMLINLSAPRIRWGNGNFKVTPEGYLTARGGGDIAGWKIHDYELYAADNSITLKAAQLTNPSAAYNATTNPYIPANIHSNNHSSLTDTHDGFYLSQDGLSIGKLFKVTNTGEVKIGNGAVSDASNASRRHWTISAAGNGTNDNSFIAYNTQTFENASNSYSSLVYLGTDGLALGKQFSVDSNGNVNINRGSIRMASGSGNNVLFYVDTVSNTVEVNMRNGSIALGGTSSNPNFSVDDEGTLTAVQGTIGGFTITDTCLHKDDITTFPATDQALSAAPATSIYMGQGGISLGKKFSVSSAGMVKILGGELRIENLHTGGVFRINNDGTFNAVEGSIGMHYDSSTGKWTGGIQIFSGEILGGTRDGNNLTSGFSLSDNGTISIGPTNGRWFFDNNGILNGGTTNPSSNYAFSKYCELQPGNGMAKFQNLDVINTISVGATLQGVNGLNLNGSGSQTFSINGGNGAALFSSVSTGGLTLNNQAITSSGPGQLSVGGTPIVAVFG